MALLASMSVMAQENAKVDVHARYTKVVTPVDGKYESKRPPVEDRLFTSTAVEKKIKEVQKLLKKNPKLAWMFANCYPNTLESTVHYRVLENGDDDTFVYTGDIPAMWLRDSGAQVWPYVALANKDEKLKKMLIQTILRSLPIKLLKLRLKMQKRKKMPMNPRILKRLWTLHLNLKNKRYRSQ